MLYVLPCCIPVQWNKLEKLGSWSWSSHRKPCARRQRTRQGTWVIGRSLSSNPKLLGSPSREKQDHMWATLPRLKRNQILAAFPQTLIDLFVRMQKLGTQRRVLPERQLVSEGCLVWSLPWSRRVSWRQGDGPAYFCSSSLGGWKRPVHKVGDAEGGGHLLPQGAFPAEVGMHAHFSFLTQSNILCISTADAQMRRACDREVMVLDFHFLSGWNCSCMLLVGLSCFWQAHFPLGSSKAMEMSRCMSCHHPWLCHTLSGHTQSPSNIIPPHFGEDWDENRGETYAFGRHISDFFSRVCVLKIIDHNL